MKNAALVLLCLAAAAAWAVPVRMLVTGDMHGMVLPQQIDGMTVGGAAEMLARWKTHEGYRPDRVLTIAMGDIATSGSLLCTLLKGAPAIDAMNAMGYDVCVIGNHEFDLGIDGFMGWQRQAAFPFISANLTLDGAPWDVVPPYIILKQNGVKVGILGLTTQHLNQRKGMPIAGAFTDVVKRYVPEMRAKGAQVVIVAAHEGSALLAKVATETADLNIPLWLGAHTHELTSIRAGAGRLVCAGEWYLHYCRIDLDYDPVSGACLVKTVRQETLAGKQPAADRALAAKLAAWKTRLPDGRATAPRVTIPRLATAPAIDGTLAPAEWDGAARLDTFWIPGSERTADPATRAWLATDGTTLYAAFRCSNVPGATLKTDATGRDTRVWEDDSIELFLWPDETKPRFVQFIVNADGMCYDADNTFNLAQRSQSDASWNPAYRVNTGREDGAWTLELALPLASAGIDPQPGKAFRLNITRN
ncbi:MAG TPA: sugar-binding protein, partial [Armatimonadota bacterium]|nr:sugar-binding protein [Armatimonadota bacterium]